MLWHLRGRGSSGQGFGQARAVRGKETAEQIAGGIMDVVEHVHASIADSRCGIAIAQRHGPETLWTGGGPGSRQSDRLLADRVVVQAAEPRPYGGDHRRSAGTWNRFARFGPQDRGG